MQVLVIESVADADTQPKLGYCRRHTPVTQPESERREVERRVRTSLRIQERRRHYIPQLPHAAALVLLDGPLERHEVRDRSPPVTVTPRQ